MGKGACDRMVGLEGKHGRCLCQVFNCMPSFLPEGLPSSLVEASACGRPIVTTNVPGCREIVRKGENGLLVEPRVCIRLGLRH